MSWWEGSEDIILGLFRYILNQREPIAFQTFVESPRSKRTAMLRMAMQKYADEFIEGEVDAIKASLSALEKLAEVRNQIAHGHCSHTEARQDDKITMSGYYLLPALNEGHWHERSLRYAHTDKSISEFVETVRLHRGKIMDISFALLQRRQQSNLELTQEESCIVAAAQAIASGQMKRERITQVLALKNPV